MECLESEVRLRHDGERRGGEGGGQEEMRNEGQGGEENMTYDPEPVIPLRIIAE